MSYGNVRLYRASGREELLKIVENIEKVTEGWGIGHELVELRKNVNRFLDGGRLNHARREIAGFVNQRCRGHETFELFEFNEILG
jgi:hypothetical protein